MRRCDIKIRIGLYPFIITFVDKKEIEGSDGVCLHNDRVIKIRDDLDEVSTMLIIRHELTHALLGTQGRVYQKKFDVEELCEFVAYKLPELHQMCEFIANSLFGGEYYE